MESLKEYLGLSSNIYILLAEPWFMELTNKWLVSFRAHQPVFRALAEQTGNANLAKGAELMDEIPVTIDEEEYAGKFATLFLGVNINATERSITPHESVYLSAKGLVKQEQWDEVYEFFVNEGIGKQDFDEPEDHIASELHFLALLSRQAAEFIEANEMDKMNAKIASRLKFINEHPLKWADMLIDHMQKLTDNPLYLSIAYLTAGFLYADSIMIEAVGEEV